MTENIMINGWTFEETVKTAENLMEAENNIFKWDVLRHLRDFAENFKDELEQYRAIGLTPELIEAMQGHNIALINDLEEYQSIGTIDEFKALKEKNVAKKAHRNYEHFNGCWCECGWFVGSSKSVDRPNYCPDCGQKLDWSE